LNDYYTNPIDFGQQDEGQSSGEDGSRAHTLRCRGGGRVSAGRCGWRARAGAGPLLVVGGGAHGGSALGGEEPAAGHRHWEMRPACAEAGKGRNDKEAEGGAGGRARQRERRRVAPDLVPAARRSPPWPPSPLTRVGSVPARSTPSHLPPPYLRVAPWSATVSWWPRGRRSRRLLLPAPATVERPRFGRRARAGEGRRSMGLGGAGGRRNSYARRAAEFPATLWGGGRGESEREMATGGGGGEESRVREGANGGGEGRRGVRLGFWAQGWARGGGY
jgi:hypothetical protein